MLRPATPADLPAMLAIRADAGEAPLSDPGLMGDAAAARAVEDGAAWVWREEPTGAIAGFAAIDAGEGAILALLVAPGAEGRGIGRALLQAACDALREAGCATATLRLPADGGSARHYRAAGWTAAGSDGSVRLVLQKTL